MLRFDIPIEFWAKFTQTVIYEGVKIHMVLGDHVIIRIHITGSFKDVAPG